MLLDTIALIGRQLGNYQIDRVLSEGGVGTDFVAHLTTDVTQLFTITVFQIDWSKMTSDAHDQVRRRFEAEARLLAGLSHPGLAAILGAGEDQDLLYTVQSAPVGSPLAARIAAGDLALDDIAQIGGQIADALAFAHDRGIVHRDLRAEHVQTNDHGQVVIFAFSPVTAPQAGRPADEVAPELADGADATRLSDLYSLGVICAALASKRPTKPGQSLVGRPDLPALAADALQRALQSMPGNRYPDVAAFAQALRAGLRADPKPLPSSVASASMASKNAGKAPQLDLIASKSGTTAVPTMPLLPPAESPIDLTLAPTLKVTATNPTLASPKRRRNPVLAILGILGILAVIAGGIFALAQPRRASSSSATVQTTPTMPAVRTPSPKIAGLPNAPQGFSGIASTDGIYGLNVPDDWSVAEQQIGGSTPPTVALVTQSPAHRAALLIMPIATLIGAEQTDMLVRQNFAAIPGAKNVNVDPTAKSVTLGANQWQQVTGTFEFDGQPQSLIALVTTHGTATYILAFFAGTPSFISEEAATFQPMAQSFTFLK